MVEDIVPEEKPMLLEQEPKPKRGEKLRAFGHQIRERGGAFVSAEREKIGSIIAERRELKAIENEAFKEEKLKLAGPKLSGIERARVKGKERAQKMVQARERVKGLISGLGKQGGADFGMGKSFGLSLGKMGNFGLGTGKRKGKKSRSSELRLF